MHLKYVISYNPHKDSNEVSYFTRFKHAQVKSELSQGDSTNCAQGRVLVPVLNA
jgi:hypothetical protein